MTAEELIANLVTELESRAHEWNEDREESECRSCQMVNHRNGIADHADDCSLCLVLEDAYGFLKEEPPPDSALREFVGRKKGSSQS